MRFFRRSLRSLIVSFLTCVSLAVAVLPASGQTPLHNLEGPQGGMIIYGTIDGANTPPDAMGIILRRLHQQYGDRPEVGRVFKVRGTDSDAVFFTLTRHSPTTMKVAGMLVVANVPGHVEAALLSDEATHFGTSINPMLQTLFQNWKPAGSSFAAGQNGGQNGGGQGWGNQNGGGQNGGGQNRQGQGGQTSMEAEAPVAPLRPYRLQDGSAMMMLAEGWRVSQASGGGTILAQGPHGETLALGFPFAAHDSRDPRAQQSRTFGQSAAGRNTLYAQTLLVPYGADLGRTLMDLNTQSRRVGGPAVSPLQVQRAQPVRPMGGSRCAIVSGISSDGSGPQQQFEGSICQSQQDSSGGFMNLANLAFVAPELAARERATLRAMLGSFQVNQAMVNAQAAALAAPTIAAIHEIGNQVNQRLQVADQQNAERRASFDQHNDVMDRTSQGFSNYQLDKSVILDNQNNAHGTTWNSTAQALVESDPKRFEYVDTPNYWKGIDY